MFRYMYLGYHQKTDVSVKKRDEIYFSVIGYYKERVFIYVETPVRELDVESVVEGGDMLPFPDGKKLFRMDKIFHCDAWEDDSILVIPVNERHTWMKMMMLEHDAPISAYVGHHYVLQEAGKTTWNRYYSIYQLGNTLISVGDRNVIAAPMRSSAFSVEIDSIIDATRPVIDNNRIRFDDGSAGWRDISP